MKRLLKYIGQKIEAIFIWSSGANNDILRSVPTEKNKYFGNRKNYARIKKYNIIYKL